MHKQGREEVDNLWLSRVVFRITLTYEEQERAAVKQVQLDVKQVERVMGGVWIFGQLVLFSMSPVCTSKNLAAADIRVRVC